MGIPMVPVLVAGVLALLGGSFFVWRGRLHGAADREFSRRSALAQGLASPGRLGPLLIVLGLGVMGVGLTTVMVWAFLALVLRVPA